MNRIPTSWMIDALHKSHLLFGLMIDGVTQEQAQTLRDGPDGWSAVEIMCHVRDYQEIFFERIRMMAEAQGEERPTIKMIDDKARQAMVEERDYAHQNLQAVYEDFLETRAALTAYMMKLQPEQWNRTGIHPLYGEIDVYVELYHAVSHDVDHAEQIGRVLAAV
jgi:hypothetical protein